MWFGRCHMLTVKLQHGEGLVLVVGAFSPVLGVEKSVDGVAVVYVIGFTRGPDLLVVNKGLMYSVVVSYLQRVKQWLLIR